jgi:hypothetical protein
MTRTPPRGPRAPDRESDQPGAGGDDSGGPGQLVRIVGRPHLLHRPGRDENWPDWYASYLVAEQAGTELPG